MKNEKGITMLALVITVVVIIILLSATVYYGTNSTKAISLENFAYELQQVQGKVDTIHEKIKLGDEKYKTYGRDITETPQKALDTLIAKKIINYNSLSEYRFFTEKNLKDTFDISSNPGDIIINFTTREVISVNGFNYDGKMYYTLDQIR